MFQKSYNDETKLYLVSTPIGNLEDITLRALKILNEVDLIVCEDTRVSTKLLKNFKINKPLFSLCDYKEEEITEKIIKFLKNGKNIALISDAGTPVISDPGYKLVKKAIDNNFNVVSIPGATAFIPALISSGIEPYPFLFYGFLSNKTEKRKKQLELLKNEKHTMIFYEAPHRLEETLSDMKEILGNKKISISREITKIHEEIFRGNINEYLENEKIIKGEFVIVIEGSSEEIIDDNKIFDYISLYINDGYSQKDAIKKVATLYNVSKNKIYDIYHKR